jgi:hypothetical protein
MRLAGLQVASREKVEKMREGRCLRWSEGLLQRKRSPIDNWPFSVTLQLNPPFVSAMWHAFSVLFRVGASLGLRHRRNPRLVCGTLSAYFLAGSKLCFYGVFVSGNIMSKALLSIGDRVRWRRGFLYREVVNGSGVITVCLSMAQAYQRGTFGGQVGNSRWRCPNG